MNSVPADSIIISKTDMKDILAKMMERHSLAAPASNGKVVDFLEIAHPDQIIMDDRIPYKSPKEFFFPRCEKLLSISKEGAVVNRPEHSTIVFGVKPCDLEALGLMSKVFTQGKYQDPFFAAHLESSLLIGVGCMEKKTGCFCDRLSVNMGFSSQCDLFLDNLPDQFQVRYVSDKGREKLAEFIPELKTFENPSVQETGAEYPLSLPLDTDRAFEQVNWAAVSEICQGCGLCTFICPTCHCFAFKDVERNGVACRFRNWDSCMFPQFTLHASGHNPRNSKTERYRQRVLHKYLYFPQNFGAIACTGCGRCVRSCPAGMNIQQIVTKIAEELS